VGPSSYPQFILRSFGRFYTGLSSVGNEEERLRERRKTFNGLLKKAAGIAKDRRGRLSHNTGSAVCQRSGTGLLACPGFFQQLAKNPILGAVVSGVLWFTPAFCQGQNPTAPGQPGPTVSGAPPETITLQDALTRAQRNEPQFLGAVNAADLAHQDSQLARAALYPSAGLSSQYLNTEGNGKWPIGRFVTNDGVHVYREWAVFHQDLSPGTLTKTNYHRATAAEAAARAKAEIARRGLALTVTKAYYGLLGAQRRYATAQAALEDAQRYVNISQALERGGEAAHSDVVRAQIQYNGQDQVLRESRLGMDNARLDLAVLISPNFEQNFQVVDNLDTAPPLPPFAEIQAMAMRENPDVRAATEAVRGANLDVTLARQAYLPTFTVDVDYGLEANQIGWSTVNVEEPEKGRVPSVGYFLTGVVNLPVWDWGARKSRLRQAELRRQQANVELTATQRDLLRDVTGFYQEAQTARDELDLLRRTADLSAENLRLNVLRYQAGEATILELVDAQATQMQARNAYDDGLVRYRVALANLQTRTGTF
jgi:outer membrane protein TolC